MVLRKSVMKRKRKEDCSLILDVAPKRTKVHAQRKFAQGSNVNSPVITPVQELIEKPECSGVDVIPDPVELLPIKRPNTEDFLTFLCFRGTPILPTNLNFFNTASIVDTNGQVHEIKTESPKNGPIDTSIIAKTGGSSERPFIAFGVRKRADPIVISKQMDRKRRHALALQALRRKYQEQKMAKIRAVTISKLSERVTNKTLVRTNSVSKTETVTKKSTIQKTKVLATKHIKVTTRTVKTTLRPKITPKMCLRSFRGRFVQRELQFRNLKKKPMAIIPGGGKKIIKKVEEKKIIIRKNRSMSSEFSSDDNEPLATTSKDSFKQPVKRALVKSAPTSKVPSELRVRVTRSNPLPANKIAQRRQQIKKQILLSSSTPYVKLRHLRSQTSLKPSLKTINAAKGKNLIVGEKNPRILRQLVTTKKPSVATKDEKISGVKPTKRMTKPHEKSTDTALIKVEKVSAKKDDAPSKKDEKKTVKKEDKPAEKSPKKEEKVVKKDERIVAKVEQAAQKKETVQRKTAKKEASLGGSSAEKKEEKSTQKGAISKSRAEEKHDALPKKKISKREESLLKRNDKKELAETLKNKEHIEFDSKIDAKVEEKLVKPSKAKSVEKFVKKLNTKECVANKEEKTSLKSNNNKTAEEDLKTVDKKETNEKKNKAETKKTETVKEVKKEQSKKKSLDRHKETEAKIVQRPSRKTKEAAAIYMEILSHKLVNESKIDDDNVSIDSFPELPNVKKTEQRENEFRAKTTQIKLEDSDKIVNEEIGVEKLEPQKCKRQTCEAECPAKKKPNPKQQKTKQIDDIDKEKMQNEILREVQEKLSLLKNPDTTKSVVESVPKKKAEPLNTTTTTTTRDLEVVKNESVPKRKPEESKAVLQKDPESLLATESVPKRKSSDTPLEEEKDKKKPKNSEETKAEEAKPKSVPESKSTKATNVSDKKKEAPQKPAAKNVPKQSKSLEVEKVVEERRQTRYSGQAARNNDDDSDESFHVDVKIPRKKQVTRNKAPKTYKSFSDSEDDSLKWQNDLLIKNVIKNCVVNENSSGESERSTTSDKNVTPKPCKAKKFTKTKSKPAKKEICFSDSDEEPLSKLTQSKPAETSTDSLKKPDDLKKGQKSVRPAKTKQKKNPLESSSKDDTIKTGKPKRECTKRPQNYLPMFSSSEDEEKLFLGFGIEKEDSPTKPVASSVLVPTTIDLSCKDIDRRFGKEKVNMSNEQIEKWLKDAAMAGNSLKKENDAMLKFGEKIPPDTLLELSADIVDTHELKTSLLATNQEKKQTTKGCAVAKLIKSAEAIQSIVGPVRSHQAQIIDRKLIFRKEIKNTVPNVSAFSVSNESSVYAFGEENEQIISTPFRRPSRRPSSTATSKSEDEAKAEESSKTVSVSFRKPSLKQDSFKCSNKTADLDEEATTNKTTPEKVFFNVPAETVKQQKFKINDDDKPLATSSPMVPPTQMLQKSKASENRSLKLNTKSFDRYSETSEDGKYKIPSSPSASSSSSAKLYKKHPKPKARPSTTTTEVCTPVNLYTFPSNSSPALLVEAPTFYPLDKEFQDPIEYIQKIRPRAEQFGICRIIPPSTFKPECKVTDDMRFTAYNQYVHKMLHRWGPNFKEFMAIKKYLKSQNIALTNSPWIGGMEIDLPRLYQTVQSLGGLKEVIEKKKWPKVSEAMKIPKSAQDRVTKLDDIYCKYLLPYETLSPAEREKLFDEVETEWAKRESKSLNPQLSQDDQTNESDESDNESEECTVKGRNIALNAFYRVARNTMAMWFKNSEPQAEEVEQEFWKHVTQRHNHICVHSGSIDSGSWGYGFAVSKNSPFARHAWNLKVLTNNSGSVLRSMGPVMGVTVPTLHVGMVFSACCWYRDPHSLPWIEYLHTGGNKIWYGIPDSMSGVFHNALTKLAPNYCKKKTLWLNSDTAMVPPSILVENGVSLSRVVQEPGQFIVVFPKAFTSSVCTGYVVSESVYFAPPQWILTAPKVFKDLRDSCEPSMFSLDRLLISVANDNRSNVDILKKIIPLIQEIAAREKVAVDKLKAKGLGETEKLPTPESVTARRRKKQHGEDGDYECDICRMNLFISMVIDTFEDGVYCVDHALNLMEEEKIQAKNCKLMYTYDNEDLLSLIDKINVAIEYKLQKKIPSKYSGMPTLLK